MTDPRIADAALAGHDRRTDGRNAAQRERCAAFMAETAPRQLPVAGRRRGMGATVLAHLRRAG